MKLFLAALLISLGFLSGAVDQASPIVSPPQAQYSAHATLGHIEWVTMNIHYAVGIDTKSIEVRGDERAATVIFSFTKIDGKNVSIAGSIMGRMQFDCKKNTAVARAEVILDPKMNVVKEQVVTGTPLQPDNQLGQVILDDVCGRPEPYILPWLGPPPGHPTSPFPAEQTA